MHRTPTRRLAIIQFAGNWRLVKYRKTYDTFECIECGAGLLIYKHPSFCEAKVVHKSCLKKDMSFDQSKVASCQFKMHYPFDEEHRRIKGKTHASVRYFAKKHLMLSPMQIVDLLKVQYPLLAKNFMPDLRKINDIAIRERQCQGEDEDNVKTEKDKKASKGMGVMNQRLRVRAKKEGEDGEIDAADAQMNLDIKDELNDDDEGDYLIFTDLKTRMEWTFNELHKTPTRQAAIIQFVGNWRLVKYRNTYDTFECMQCGACLLIYKHPSFCEAKVVHKTCVKKDWNFDESKVEGCEFKKHYPFDEEHARVAGKTHASVRYFTKKHLRLPPQ